uniref:RE21847p n=1 Tax=Drosophila melanogaster TaxID=7227 RepID=Q8IGV7_DROME|nr:RE21847p [Drosophila melanogaster]
MQRVFHHRYTLSDLFPDNFFVTIVAVFALPLSIFMVETKKLGQCQHLRPVCMAIRTSCSDLRSTLCSQHNYSLSSLLLDNQNYLGTHLLLSSL